MKVNAMLHQKLADFPVGWRHMPETVPMRELGITLVSGGHQYATPRYAVSGRTKPPGFSFTYTVSGKGTLHTDGDTHELPAGVGFALPAPGPYDYRRIRNEPWEYCWFKLEGPDAVRLGQLIARRSPPLILLSRHPDVIKTACTLLSLVFATGEIDPWEPSRFATQFMHQLHRAAWAATFDQRRDQAEDHPVRVALRYLHRHIKDPTSLDEIAALTGISRAHFCRLFREYTGTSPTAYQLTQRIQHACSLLKSSEMPVKVVAVESGFADPNYFCRRFRAIMKCSPLEFRHNADRPAQD